MDNDDIRLLTLHKQHYLDRYNEIKIGNYSCLGYYDAISIRTATGIVRGELTKKKSKEPFSTLWYVTGMQVESQRGGYSNQNIGLFRDTQNEQNEKYTSEYWNQEKDLPYFAVGFLKLCENVNLGSAKEIIEGFCCTQSRDLPNCRVITYDTFDNADLVMLLKGNSLALMHDVFERVEELEEVIYLHTILGIEEQYLKDCKEQNVILNTWHGYRCCIDETIARICFRLAGSSVSQMLSDIKKQWELCNHAFLATGYENTEYSYVPGHGNVTITLKKTDVRTLLSLLLPNGLLTHGNSAYNRSLYNIETEIVMQERSWQEIEAYEMAETDTNKTREWCINSIEKYCKKLSYWCRMQDEGMYSYYQALVQTLSMLDQYERFKMSRDIFFLIYPSFRMLDEQLERVADYQNQGKNSILKLESVKRELNEYLECINSVIYHTIHTDQIYLMIPGYSGTSFSIPIKCSLFYMWFTKAIACVLNDNKRQYSCILTPGMESKATTRMIIIDERENENKIISLKLSQRHLYFPSNIMIILSHELAHYIGREIRCRKRRMECISMSLAGYIAEGIFPEGLEVIGGNVEIVKWYKENFNQKLQKVITELMFTHMKELCPDDHYHAQDIRGAFLTFTMELLSDVGVGAQISKWTKDLPEELAWIVDKDSDHVGANMRDIYHIQRQIERNIRILSSSRVMDGIVEDVIEIFREVFSDIAAYSILEFELDDFEEAFLVSEGLAMSVNSKQHRMRREVLATLIDDGQAVHTALPETAKNESARLEIASVERYLTNRTYEFAFLYENLVKYARTCYGEISFRLENFRDKVQQIRSVYEMFTSQQKSLKEIYDVILECIDEYRKDIWKEYLSERDKNS